MRNACVLLLTMLLLPKFVGAEPAIVQSGEHENFSRIVVPSKGTGWAVKHEGRDVVLSFDGFSEGFETSKVFDFIPRTRIKSLSTNDKLLTLTLGCDCVVSAVTERDLYIVIDVAVSKSMLQNAPLISTLTKRPSAIDRIRPEVLAALYQEVQHQSRPTVFNRETLPFGGSQILTNLQDRLTKEMRTAALRGILKPGPSRNAAAVDHRAQVGTLDLPAAVPKASGVPEPREASPITSRNFGNLRISTSRDFPQTFRNRSEITNSTGHVCPTETEMAVSTWGDDRPFAIQIGEARQSLFGELDRINHAAALKLAQTYLYFGFGAEAREILMLVPKFAENTDELIAMSNIMDGKALNPENPLAELTGCHGDTALWATLAAQIPSQGSLPSSAATLRAFNTLPAHLRIILAPRLNEILLAYGDPIGAVAALRSLDRLSGEASLAAKLAQAKTDLHNGDNKRGTEELAKLVAENTPQSPAALIALVTASQKSGQVISAETASLVDAYAHELRESDLGPALRRAHVIALVQSGQFDLAFTSSAILSGTEPEGRQVELRSYILRELTGAASDIVFLDNLLPQPEEYIAALSNRDLLALSDRLLALGFPDRAELALRNLPDRPKQNGRQLLSARISLAMGKPQKAQADLLGIRNTEAELLRADAKRMSGAHSEAHVIYSKMNHSEDATETAWLSNDWRSLTAQNSPVFGPASSLLPPPSLSGEAVGMLSHSKTLLEKSVNAREILQELLDADELQVLVVSE